MSNRMVLMTLTLGLVAIFGAAPGAIAQASAASGANQLGLILLKGEFAVCALERRAAVPAWASDVVPVSITRSTVALSIIAPAAVVPRGTVCDKQWRAFEVE